MFLYVVGNFFNNWKQITKVKLKVQFFKNNLVFEGFNCHRWTKRNSLNLIKFLYFTSNKVAKNIEI
jgi:hypothetical protein